VFAVGALDAYLSDVSAEVMIAQCQKGPLTAEAREAMKQVQRELPGLALEVSLMSEQSDRMDRIKQAIVDHFQTSVSMHGSKGVSTTVQRMGGSPRAIWDGMKEAGWNEPADRLDEWTAKRHDIVHRGITVSVRREKARYCIDLLVEIAARVEGLAQAAIDALDA